MWEGIDEPLEDGNWPVIAPSPIAYCPRNQVPREMTRADMDVVREQFVGATRAARSRPGSICSSSTARTATCCRASCRRWRTCATDPYGGSLEARARFPLEVFDACRAAWPADQADERPDLGDRLGRRAGSTPTRRWSSRGCCATTAATSSMSPRARYRRSSALRSAAATRRRSPTGSATRSGSRRSRSARSPPTTTSTRSCWPAAPTCARWRGRTSTTRTGRCTPPPSRATPTLAWVPQYRRRVAQAAGRARRRRAQGARADVRAVSGGGAIAGLRPHGRGPIRLRPAGRGRAAPAPGSRDHAARHVRAAVRRHRLVGRPGRRCSENWASRTAPREWR